MNRRFELGCAGPARRFGLRSRAGLALRWIAVALLAVLLLPLLPGAAVPARAEGSAQLRIEVSVQPENLIGPGDVMLSFTIENVSGTEARNVYLSSADGLISELVGQIASGETQSFNRPHSVTAQELDAGVITYTVSHDDPNDPKAKVNYSVSARIRRSDAMPSVEFTRQFSSRSVEAGDTLTITYRVRNTGNVPLSNLQVEDSLGSFTGRVEALEAGESRTLINRATVTEATVSSASLSYRTAEDEQPRTQSLEDVPIGIAAPDLSASFTVDHSAFSGSVANAVLMLRNTGNVDYRDICVIDDLYGGVIADELTLPAGGEPLEVSRAYNLRGEQELRWRVTAVSASGARADFVTDTLGLAPLEGGSAEALTLTARALTPRIRRGGNVRVRVNIENAGGVELRDLVLSEASQGDLHSFAVLNADGAIEREFSLYVNGDASFFFSLRATDMNGAEVSAVAEPVEVVIAQDGALPEGARDTLLDFTGGSIKIGGSSTFAAVLIAGFAVLLALVVALIVVSRRTKRARADAEKRRREEAGKTGRIPTVRANPKPRPKGNKP